MNNLTYKANVAQFKKMIFLFFLTSLDTEQLKGWHYHKVRLTGLIRINDVLIGLIGLIQIYEQD